MVSLPSASSSFFPNERARMREVSFSKTRKPAETT
jgi:hypothetical protein